MISSVGPTPEREINCLLVSGLDPLTGNLRTGTALRYNNPPPSVKYSLRVDRLAYPKKLGHYGVGLSSVPLGTAQLFTEAVFPLNKGNNSIIHSIFWSIHRYPIPWIHENDQSLGQYFSDYLGFEGTVMRKIVRVAAGMLNAEKCKAIVLWSNWARDGYINDGIDRKKIVVIPPAFETRERRTPHDTTNILFLGRDYKRKGGDVALKVFENLKKSHDNLHMTFIGKIPDREKVEKIKEYRNISYFEFVSKRNLHEKIFPETDIFLLPTRAEAYGMSIIEAMSYGIPVVSSNISAIPEVVEDGVSGYLAPPRSVDMFTQQCGRLIDDREKREKMGKNAIESIARDFSREKIGSKLRDLYLRCMS
ncbi:MAG: glycosyltransferase family 4 protein [Nitrososphaerota archaeon]|nr:glycosyltransferase family 4 protein [Nitrososphaerota archaeon]MDG6923466.1 glycosyltransferase family 4 protein [Nitrososphaerota archaeon]